jgi:hypothetical protein
MKQKGVVVSQDEIADLKKKKINIAWKPPKTQSSIAYADLKSTDAGFEVQIVLEHNANERNFSNHTVYDLKKIIAANARLFGPLTLNSLWYILEHYRPEWLIWTGQFDFHRVALFSHLVHIEDAGKNAFLTVFKRHGKYYFIPREILFVQGNVKNGALRDIYSNLPDNFELYENEVALSDVMLAMNTKSHVPTIVGAKNEYVSQELAETL